MNIDIKINIQCKSNGSKTGKGLDKSLGVASTKYQTRNQQ